MKIDKLYLYNFKNLRDFQIDFDETSLVTVLLGWNGAGKSNVLEALVMIFKDLDLAKSPSLQYKISYIVRGKKVDIDVPTQAIKDVKILINGESCSFSKFTGDNGREYRPAHVFGYYSGPSNRLESHFEDHQDRFYKELLKGNDKALRSLFYARPVHSQFVLLSFFKTIKEERYKFLNEFLGIEQLESVLFVMRQPPWYQGKPSSERKRNGDPRFWYSVGVVQQFLDRLYEISLAPMRHEQRTVVEFQKEKTLEHIYLYIQDSEHLSELASAYETQRDFFKVLESTYISKLLAEVRIRVKIRNVDGSLTFRELSEGEQQLLTVLGLLEFTKEEESLFLLDEPDTHLNPSWSMEYLDLIRKIVGEKDNSHIIMATHDPLVIADLQRSQVQVMRRDIEAGKIIAEKPEEDPRGMGVAAILTSDMFGLRSTLDKKTLELLDEKRILASKEALNDEDIKRLSDLNKRLSGLDFATSFRDPLYEQFLKVLFEDYDYEDFRKPVLTNEQRAEQKKLIKEIINKVKDKQGSLF